MAKKVTKKNIQIFGTPQGVFFYDSKELYLLVKKDKTLLWGRIGLPNEKMAEVKEEVQPETAPAEAGEEAPKVEAPTEAPAVEEKAE